MPTIYRELKKSAVDLDTVGRIHLSGLERVEGQQYSGEKSVQRRDRAAIDWAKPIQYGTSAAQSIRVVGVSENVFTTPAAASAACCADWSSASWYRMSRLPHGRDRADWKAPFTAGFVPSDGTRPRFVVHERTAARKQSRFHQPSSRTTAPCASKPHSRPRCPDDHRAKTETSCSA